ncbi:unnamed protein product [Paramecium octaurelia]|uniref:Uncharacterized protein n=1 Tax=Paramecium octaurelia TaxID=43137 RepID=A0A8S1UNH9_PAROT|nr:unnamed protein product [Paramecium octaurelia]
MDNVEVEVKKQLNYLKSPANPKDFPKIMDIYKNPIQRILKLNFYPLLKTFPSSELICLELEKDFSNQDYEIQLQSLKLTYSIPFSNLIQIFNSCETAFYYIIEQLCAVNSILQLLLTKETKVDSIEMPKLKITNIYLRVAENCFSNNRDISANYIKSLSKYLQSKLQNPNYLTSVNYDTEQIKQSLLLRIQLLYEKYDEVRIRSKMLFLVSQVLLDSLNRCSTVQQNQNKLIYKLNPHGFHQQNYQSQACMIFCNIILKWTLQYKFSTSQSILFLNINLLVTLMRASLCCSFMIASKNIQRRSIIKRIQSDIALNSVIRYGFEYKYSYIHTNYRNIFPYQNQLSRLLFLLYYFDNLNQKSIELLYQKDQCHLKTVQLDLDEPEELICCLIIAAIHQETNKLILLEIKEICNAFIWNGCNIEAIIMQKLLIQECIKVIPSDEIWLNDLINRMNTNQISFNQKVQTLLIITRKFNESSLNCKIRLYQYLGRVQNLHDITSVNLNFSAQSLTKCL